MRLPYRIVKDDPTPDSAHVDVPLGSDGKPKKPRAPHDLDENDLTATVVKADTARRLVYGIVLEPHTPDSQGDWETPADIEKAAHDFLYKRGPIGLQHRALAPGSVRLVESFIAPADFAYPENPADVIRKGSWVAVGYVADDTVWKAVESGVLNSWSIGGTGRRVNEDPAG